MKPHPLRAFAAKVRPINTSKFGPSAKITDPFYGSAEWQQLMARIIKQRGRRCEDPEHDPATPRVGVRIYGDHIVERRDGGADLDQRNILLRCASCHTRKT